MEILTVLSTVLRFFLCLLIVLSPCESLCAQPIINGAGATFPSPLYYKWISASRQDIPARILYRETGSSEGLRLLMSRKIDFGASDFFLSDTEMRKAPAPLLHIPTCIGAVAIIYNLADHPEIRLTSDILADIFQGRITFWTDSRIRKVNPRLSLPPLKITLIHRSEGSGTTFLLTDHLSKVSPSWRKLVGTGQTVRWPRGLGVEGNAGVAGMVKKIPGSIGYVSLNYAVKNSLPAAALQNASGRFIKPTVESVSAAASAVLPPDGRLILTNNSAPDAYPVCGFTYMVVFRELAYKGQSLEYARTMAKFLWWCVHDGQRYAEPLHYAPLPKETVKQVEQIIRSIAYKGRPVL